MNDSAVATQELPAKETKRRESRAVISAKAQTILVFLRNCKPYKADSIRVMVGYALGTIDVESIDATDILSVNRFLNHELTKEDATSAERIVQYRQAYCSILFNRQSNRLAVRQHSRPFNPLLLYTSTSR